MSDSAKKYTIAVIPGDGIGKEVTPWAQKALEKAAEGVAEFEYEKFDLGAERYLRDGAILPEEEEERIKKTDAILLGAVGDPRIKAGILERGLLLKLRFDLDQYVNLRPSKLYKGVTSPLANPGDIDFVVVREGTEGLYCGAGGAVRRGTPNEVATEVSINTAYGVERVIAGPKVSGNYPTLPNNTQIISVSSSNRICFVNLNRAFTDMALAVDPRIPVYSLVDALVDNCDSIDSVQISIDGESNISFRDSVNLSKPLTADHSLVQEE